VAGPHVGRQARSAAAGQRVLPGADAPRTGPLGLLELAAADLGAPALALLVTGNLGMLGRFATRHRNSLSTAIAEVEFFAFSFFDDVRSDDRVRKFATDS
jgi:hypothetical protein